MLLKSKKVAYAGIMMALGVLFLLLSNYLFESSSFVFITLAAMLVGVVQRNFSVSYAFAYLAGCALLGVLLVPQKFYIATYLGVSLYIILEEWLEKKQYFERKKISLFCVWGSKALLYHILIVVAFFLYGQLFGLSDLFTGTLLGDILGKSKLFAGIIVVAVLEILWILVDRSYLFLWHRYGRVLTLE